MRIVEVTPQDKDLIESYAARDPFNPYRHYPLAKGKGKGVLFAREVVDLLGGGNLRAWMAFEGSDPLGMLGLEPLSWDSQHFGMPMGRLWPASVMSHEGAQATMASQSLLSTALDECAQKGIQHLAARVDGENVPFVHALERQGFLLMDTLVTYLYRRAKDRVPEGRAIYRVRLFEDKDLEAIMDIARQGQYKGRFTQDPWVSQDRVMRMYEAWAQRSCEKIVADEVLVAEAGAEVRGFLGYRKNQFFTEQTGLELWGGGLGVVSRQGVGAYASLLRAAVLRDFEGRDESVQPNIPDLIDFDTQLSNAAILRVWQEFGYRMVRFSHAFHRGGL